MSVSVVIGYFQDFPSYFSINRTEAGFENFGFEHEIRRTRCGRRFVVFLKFSWHPFKLCCREQVEKSNSVNSNLAHCICSVICLERLHSSRSWISLAFGSRVKLLSKWSIILRAIFQKIEKKFYLVNMLVLKAKLRGNVRRLRWGEQLKGTYLCLLIPAFSTRHPYPKPITASTNPQRTYKVCVCCR